MHDTLKDASVAPRKCISVVSPCYNEEENVERCRDKIRELFETDEVLRHYDHEHIFCDNASKDRTVEILKSLAAEDRRVKIIVNARNYGPFRSTFNALKYVSGDATIPMLPVDLQDPPELIPKFVTHWESGMKRIYGIRTEREEGRVLRSLREFYYLMVNKFSTIDIPRNVSEFQLIDRQVLDALLQYNDHYPYIRGMLANIGFERSSIGIPYTWNQRTAGISKNRLFNLIDQAINGLISFSNFPMRATAFFGLSIAVLSILYAIFQALYNLIWPGDVEDGIPTLIVALFFFSGLQFIFLGVLGEYIAAIHFQVRQGNIVVEEEKINFIGEEVS